MAIMDLMCMKSPSDYHHTIGDANCHIFCACTLHGFVFNMTSSVSLRKTYKHMLALYNWCSGGQPLTYTFAVNDQVSLT